jgi:cytoskeleton protein RodZ
MADSDQPSAAPAAASAATNLGELLRSARLAQGLTPEQLATELRIEAQHLTALEENKFERIGIPVFVKGYLRQYGQRLGLDVGRLHALYAKQAKLEEVQIQPSPTIHLRDERQITVWIVAAIVLAAIIGALAMWWTSGGSFDFISTAVTPTPSASSAAPAPAPAGVTSSPAPVAIPVAAPAPIAVPDPAATPAVEAPSAPTETVAPSEGEADANADTVPAIVAAVTGPPTLPLELVFAEESWAEVTDARGQRLFYGLGAANQRAPVRGEPPFAVVLGNATAVQLFVDGDPFVVPTEGRQGNLARFTVDAEE